MFLSRKDNLTAHIKKQHDTTKQEKCEVLAVPDSTTVLTGGTNWPDSRLGTVQPVCLPTIAVGDIVLTTTSTIQDQQYSSPSNVAQEIFVTQSQSENCN